MTTTTPQAADMFSDLEFIFSHVPGWVLWVAVVLVIAAFFASRLAETYEGLAKFLGPLGRRAQRVAQERAIERARQFRDIAHEVVQNMSRPPDYDQLKRDLMRVIARVQEMEESEEVSQAYLIHDAQWHFEVDEYLAEQGVTIPHRIGFREFSSRYRAGFRLDDNDQWVRVGWHIEFGS
jgi:hypothetical protein